MIYCGMLETSGWEIDTSGTLQDLIHTLRTNMKPVRLVVINYVGLSMDFEDIYRFVSKYKQIVELVVDAEYTFGIIPRAGVLSGNNVSTKFNCGIGPQTEVIYNGDEFLILSL
ncbi:hypothetical protein BD408DRAFT_436179 [Parasitella parasitica]|nr:hypothetical protein BD408DRAFT_436179 [Parasitella parasitica]